MVATIAVVGSASPRLDYGNSVRDAAEARVAARELGRELANAGFDLGVYSSRSDFIERDVVDGYIRSDHVRPGSVRALSRYGFDDADFASTGQVREIVTHVRDSSTD